MPREASSEGPSEEERAQFRKRMEEMATARIEMFAANSAKYAKALGTFRAALQKSGFTREEAMQIILRVVEQPGRPPRFWGGHGGHWHKS